MKLPHEIRNLFHQEEKTYLSREWNGLSVFYTPQLDGGGLVFADDYLALLESMQAMVNPGRIYEWCSGPGFIGYALLAHKFGTSLCLTDFYQPAIDVVKHTAHFNKIEDRVSVYHGDGVLGLPQHEKFDLVVGNPPQFQNRIMLELLFAHDPKTDPRIYVDPEWRLHKQFFNRISNHLKDDGVIILTECSGGAHVETFRPMIEEAGLYLAGWKWPKRGKDMFYVFVTKKDTRVKDKVRAFCSD